jgi:hypothetical protein
MVQETAVVVKPSTEEDQKSNPRARFYEVIVKFHRDGRPVIEAFLVANMAHVTISATENSDVLLAYCHFQGDITTLDGKLTALRQSAMVVLGDKEEKFLDFFVALRQLSKPLPRLLVAPQGATHSVSFNPDWIKGFAVALGFFLLWQGYQLASAFISRALNPPPPSAVSTSLDSIISQWAPYVLPEYHRAWLEVKKKHGLNNGTMVDLFRAIKVNDKYGPGHYLRDLTIYPGAVDRALSLITVKDVGDLEDLQALFKTLEGYSARWKALPDQPSKSSLQYSLTDTASDNIVLNFYEHLLKEPRRDFTTRLISELRQSHLSP